MFYLCSFSAADSAHIFGDFGIAPEEISNPPKYPNLVIIPLGQKIVPPGYADRMLVFSNEVPIEFTQHNSVPEGYEFTFRQEWGLTINEEILHRVISTLRSESYPPIADYLDAVVKNDQVQMQNYLDACLAVKQKYPKFSF